MARHNILDIEYPGLDTAYESTIVVTFDGTDGKGLNGGSTTSIFTVQDDGLLAVVGKGVATPTGTGTFSVGKTSSATAFTPAITASTVTVDTRFDKTGIVSTSTPSDAIPYVPVVRGEKIFLTIGTSNITGGQVRFNIFYRPYGSSVSTASGTGASSSQSQGAGASGATSVGNPNLIGIQYNTTEPTVTSGQTVTAQGDNRGNQYSNMINRLDPINDGVLAYPFGHAYATITTATTTTVKTGAGVLHAITLDGGTAGAITVYDNTAGSGTVIFPAFTPGSVSVPITLTVNVGFSTGLTIVTGAATIITVSYR